jgi:hypothetical protein
MLLLLALLLQNSDASIMIFLEVLFLIHEFQENKVAPIVYVYARS